MNYENNCDPWDDTPDNLDVAPYCEDCKWLMEAVRDLEQQCREVENERIGDVVLSVRKTPAEVARDEDRFRSTLKKLEYRRNAALDVLAKHQQLEH